MAVSAVQGYGYIGESRGYVYDSTLMAWIAATPGTAGGGSTQVSIREILTSSGASVMDSTASAINVNVVAGSAAGDTTATVTQASTVWAVQVDGRVRAQNSTAADFIAKVTPNDTNFASSAGFHFGSTGDVVVGFQRASTLTRASLTQSSTTVTAQSSNANRLGWTCVNNPTQGSILYLKFGVTASTTDFDVRLLPFAYYEMPQPIYTGRIDAIWDSTGVGFARTAEWIN